MLPSLLLVDQGSGDVLNRYVNIAAMSAVETERIVDSFQHKTATRLQRYQIGGTSFESYLMLGIWLK
jgi:hypothetical protein